MRVRRPALIALAVVLLPFMSHGSVPRVLTFEDRVKAQEAIERVYYLHQIGARRPFEEVFGRQVLESKVRTYLEQSAALEAMWDTPVTSSMLQAEISRIARSTRLPARLDEIFEALGHDSLLVQDCFARQVLVDRLARGYFSFDRRLHAETRAKAELLRKRLGSGQPVERVSYARPTLVTLRRLTPGESRGERTAASASRRGEEGMTIALSDPEFSSSRSELVAGIGTPGPVVEHRAEFVIGVLLTEDRESMRIASYEVPKIGWDEWWRHARRGLNWRAVRAVAEPTGAMPGTMRTSTPASPPSVDCVPEDVWDNRALGDVPVGMYGHTTVWTGDRMIIWGGRDGAVRTRYGHWYDPLTDTWGAISGVGAPTARNYHSAVWTGSRMLIWGGEDDETAVNSGGSYDPQTDTWTNIAMTGAPEARGQHTAIWTGERMIIWGGYGSFDTGGIYDPKSDTWSATSTVGAPIGRYGHTAVWTGDRMIVWGGYYGLNTGGIYVPASDTWSATSIVGAPTGRSGHTAVWTGDRMIVWGGFEGSAGVGTSSGGLYDPQTNLWTATSLDGAPAARAAHTAVWSGSQMIVWGGSTLDSSGGRYDPSADVWLPTTMEGAPSGREGHGAIWTGTRMVVWGGTANQPTNTGGQYDPDQDSWTPTGNNGAPLNRSGHSAVWTGSRMLIWGGGEAEGGQYDPLTDNWTPISAPSDPSIFPGAPAVWTGDRMIAWNGGFTGAGGRYDPVTDTWSAMSTVGSPTGRGGYAAVWTGDRLIIWGGSQYSQYSPTYLSSGGRYDPVTDTWSAMSTVGAPSGRAEFTAVWTGDRMVIWGGSQYSQYSPTYLSSGGRYDPVADTWSATSTAGVPYSRAGHTAIWTGSRMIIWGGYHLLDSPYMRDGGQYDPSTDTWMATSEVEVPTGRFGHTAVWTGSRMIVWGGYMDNAFFPERGGLYDPGSDTWLPMSTVDVPFGREGHTAVWTGGSMIVWGGSGGTRELNGGIYGSGSISGDTDADGDTFSVCGGDCDDADPARYPGAREVCDGVDNNCDGGIDGFVTSCGRGECAAGGVCEMGLDTCLPVSPTAERCDGRDNDCDGVTDEDLGMTACGAGACARTIDNCVGGVPKACVAGPPTAESCNGIDDDCDGVVDEGLGPGNILVSLNPTELWPPNHQLVDIHATVTISGGCPAACSAPPGVVLVSVSSNEPDDADGTADGHTLNDIQDATVGSSDFDLKLRAERNSQRDGRVYQVSYAVTDCFGTTAIGYASVAVPRNQGRAN